MVSISSKHNIELSIYKPRVSIPSSRSLPLLTTVLQWLRYVHLDGVSTTLKHRFVVDFKGRVWILYDEWVFHRNRSRWHQFHINLFLHLLLHQNSFSSWSASWSSPHSESFTWSSWLQSHLWRIALIHAYLLLVCLLKVKRLIQVVSSPVNWGLVVMERGVVKTSVCPIGRTTWRLLLGAGTWGRDGTSTFNWGDVLIK